MPWWTCPTQRACGPLPPCLPAAGERLWFSIECGEKSISPLHHNFKCGRRLMITRANAGASMPAHHRVSASAHEVIDAVEPHEADNDQIDRDDEVEQSWHE